jgi:tRNA 5-methylaminomethyl-2-thiouridine biosynthesis bifunctional protein
MIGAPALESLRDEELAAMPGRVGWRAVAPDRLPWVGALPDPAACAQAVAGRHRIDAPPHVPRLRDAEGGLYAIGAFGSRGIGWAALCGELLASWITGAPCPAEADLRDALDPARGWLRARRQA